MHISVCEVGLIAIVGVSLSFLSGKESMLRRLPEGKGSGVGSGPAVFSRTELSWTHPVDSMSCSCSPLPDALDETLKTMAIASTRGLSTP